jgi:hypothetical protein
MEKFWGDAKLEQIKERSALTLWVHKVELQRCIYDENLNKIIGFVFCGGH